MTIAGMLIASGLLGVVLSLMGVQLLPEPSHPFRPPRISPIALVAVATGILVLIVTGWPVAAIGIAAAVVFIPSVFGGGKAAQASIAQSEALAFWTRRLADLLSSGAAGSIQQALRKAATSADEPLRAATARLADRLGPRGVEPALRMFAREVADPAADQVAGMLIIRERNGGPGLAQALAALADDLDERARMLRDVEAEREKPRSSMRAIVGSVSALIVLMLLFLGDVLTFYSSFIGQVCLAAVVGLFAFGLRWMKRLANAPNAPSVLITDAKAVLR